MSYDLVVFDPDAAPTEHAAFLAWFRSHDDEADLFDATRSDFSTPKLRSWLEEVLKTFPAMNGHYAAAEQDVDDPHLTDYGIERTHIYACFAWSVAESAYNTVMSLADKYGIAVYEISDPEGAIWRPNSDGKLC